MFFPILQDWRSEPPGSLHPRLCLSPKRCSPGTCPHPSTCFQGHPVPLASLPAGWCGKVGALSGQQGSPSTTGALLGLAAASLLPAWTPLSLYKSLQILGGGNSSAHCGQAPSQLEITCGQALGAPMASALPAMFASEWRVGSGGPPPGVPGPLSWSEQPPACRRCKASQCGGLEAAQLCHPPWFSHL